MTGILEINVFSILEQKKGSYYITELSVLQ
mgnify:CR=1 FL=1